MMHVTTEGRAAAWLYASRAKPMYYDAVIHILYAQRHADFRHISAPATCLLEHDDDPSGWPIPTLPFPPCTSDLADVAVTTTIGRHYQVATPPRLSHSMERLAGAREIAAPLASFSCRRRASSGIGRLAPTGRAKGRHARRSGRRRRFAAVPPSALNTH